MKLRSWIGKGRAVGSKRETRRGKRMNIVGPLHGEDNLAHRIVKGSPDNFLESRGGSLQKEGLSLRKDRYALGIQGLENPGGLKTKENTQSHGEDLKGGEKWLGGDNEKVGVQGEVKKRDRSN